MRKVNVSEFVSLDGVAENPAWTFQFGSEEWAPAHRLHAQRAASTPRARWEASDSCRSEPPVSLPLSDMVMNSRGNAYLGNLGFTFPGGEFAPGILVLVTPDGLARQVAEGCAFANGMVVTPDNSTLILAESYGHRLTAFDIEEDGGLSNRREWADLGSGYPDGICLDGEGAIWYADVPARRCVRVRQGGEVLQTVEIDRGCFAFTLGGGERRTLFLMAAEYPPASWGPGAPRTGQVLTFQASSPGAGWP